MLFEHKKTGERVRPADGSKNEQQLVAKAADPNSGWSRVDEKTNHDQPTTGGLVRTEKTGS